MRRRQVDGALPHAVDERSAEGVATRLHPQVGAAPPLEGDAIVTAGERAAPHDHGAARAGGDRAAGGLGTMHDSGGELGLRVHLAALLAVRHRRDPHLLGAIEADFEVGARPRRDPHLNDARRCLRRAHHHAGARSGRDEDGLVDAAAVDAATVAGRNDHDPAGLVGPYVAREGLLPEHGAVVGAVVRAHREVHHDGRLLGVGAVEHEVDAREEIGVLDAVGASAGHACEHEARPRGDPCEARRGAHAPGGGDGRHVGAVTHFVLRQRPRLREQPVDVGA